MTRGNRGCVNNPNNLNKNRGNLRRLINGNLIVIMDLLRRITGRLKTNGTTGRGTSRDQMTRRVLRRKHASTLIPKGFNSTTVIRRPREAIRRRGTPRPIKNVCHHLRHRRATGKINRGMNKLTGRLTTGISGLLAPNFGNMKRKLIKTKFIKGTGTGRISHMNPVLLTVNK